MMQADGNSPHHGAPDDYLEAISFLINAQNVQVFLANLVKNVPSKSGRHNHVQKATETPN